MYLLTFYQGMTMTDVGLFETLDHGREFVSQIPGYQCIEEEGFIDESIDPGQIPSYLEIEYHGYLIPLTRWMFVDQGKVLVDWQELPNLSQTGQGMIAGSTRLDAYHIENRELKEYIKQREANYEWVKDYLQAKGYQVDRAYQGSEDGEAIVYQAKDHSDWHFLCHMDPAFVEERDLETAIEGWLVD